MAAPPPPDTAELTSSCLPLPGTPKTGSLPRQKRRGDLPPSPNVAIVSPMPVPPPPQQRSQREGAEGEEEKKSREESEDPLLGIAPMAPLGGLFRGRGQERTAGAAETAVHTALLTGERYMNQIIAITNITDNVKLNQ